MKRILMLGALLLLLIGLGGCSLVSDKDVQYIVTQDAGNTLTITIVNDNGDLEVQPTVTTASWSTSFKVSGSEPFLAFVQVEGSSALAYTVDAEIRVDGSTRAYSSDTGTIPQAVAVFVVD